MPTIKGTMSVTDDHAMKKLLKKTQFPSNFGVDITLEKINIPVMSQWVERKITELLGFEDEIVASTAINLFLPTTDPAFDAAAAPPKIDPKRAQLNLAGFLGEDDAAAFCKELWTLLIDAQETPTGIPRKLLEETKKEMASRQRQHYQASRPRHQNPAVMNPMVREASRRAEAAREALANGPHEPRRGNWDRPLPPNPPAAAAPRRDPVEVSPLHPSEQPPPFEPARPPPDHDGRHQRNEEQVYPSPSRRERDSRRRRNDSESSSGSSSRSSSPSYDSAEEDRRRHRRDRERWRREEDRRRRYERDSYNRDQDEYGRRRRNYREEDERRYRENDRDRYERSERSERRSRDHHRRRRRSRDRSRSHDRNDDRRRRRHRSRSYSDSS